MATPCRATMRVGCPDEPATLVCHRPAHPDRDHYDAAEQVWWRPNAGDEPDLCQHAPPSHLPPQDTSG